MIGAKNRVDGTGTYTDEEQYRMKEFGDRMEFYKKPIEAYYKKSANEPEPSWAERRNVGYCQILTFFNSLFTK